MLYITVEKYKTFYRTVFAKHKKQQHKYFREKYDITLYETTCRNECEKTHNQSTALILETRE